MEAIAENETFVKLSGINITKYRYIAIIFSTVLAAALLVGGATLKTANIKNAFVRILLSHTLFIVSSLAGQYIFQNAALGEYFRSFLSYIRIFFIIFYKYI